MKPVLNLYEDVRSKIRCNRFEIGDLLFAEYTCPIEEKQVAVWAHTDYLIHVISGKKAWHTTAGSWTLEGGQTVFFKKGAAVVEQFFDEGFCLLIFFVPDDFVRTIVREYAATLPALVEKADPRQPAIRVANDVALAAFFESMKSYFFGEERPSEALLALKFRELIVGILHSRNNPGLSAYFRAIAAASGPSLADVMESNFRYNLSLGEFAALCHRSLSSFKRDFTREFREPPGKWLLRKRLEYSAVLLRSGGTPVSQIVFECGFEDLSHFSRVFKEKFGVSPRVYRQQAGPAA